MILGAAGQVGVEVGDPNRRVEGSVGEHDGLGRLLVGDVAAHGDQARSQDLLPLSGASADAPAAAGDPDRRSGPVNGPGVGGRPVRGDDGGTRARPLADLGRRLRERSRRCVSGSVRVLGKEFAIGYELRGPRRADGRGGARTARGDAEHHEQHERDVHASPGPRVRCDVAR